MQKWLSVVIATIFLGVGCGKNSTDDSIAKKAGNKLGETLTDFTTGVGSGIDKQMTVKVDLSEKLKAKGIKKTIAKLGGMDSGTNKLIIYFISEQAQKLTIVAKALNKEGQEIGRSVIEASFSKDDGKYLTFNFESEMDKLLVDKYSIDLKEN
jgi:hypothetical protein